MREWMSAHFDKRAELLLSASDERKLLKIFSNRMNSSPQKKPKKTLRS